MKLNGRDVSHHNIREFAEINSMNFEFLMIKASEGKTWRDKTMQDWAGMGLQHGAVLGFYHYARPENNSAEDEAENFYNAVYNYLDDGAVLALDWEGEAEKCDPAWIQRFAQVLKDKGVTGGELMVYCNKSTFQKIKPYMENNGLWLASWGNKIHTTYNGYLVAIQQTGSDDLSDIDIFNGTVEGLCYYRSFKKVEEEKGGNSYCGCTCCK